MITSLNEWKKLKLNENATITAEDELNRVERWLKNTGPAFDDWDWNGTELVLFDGAGHPIEHYSRQDLIDAGVELSVEAPSTDEAKKKGEWTLSSSGAPEMYRFSVAPLNITEDAQMPQKENSKSVCCHAPVYMEGSTSMCMTCKRPCECVPVTEDAPEMAEKMSDKAKDFISNKIKFLIDKEHKPHTQAIAIAYSMAKNAGFKIPDKE